MTRRISTAALVFHLMMALPVIGGHNPVEEAPPEKLVLVLSGGGARGTAHVGVLEVLEELHIAPDLIIGTSMGSIVGGLYAAGWSPQEMKDLLASMDWDQVFSDSVPRRAKTFRRKQDDRPVLIPARIHFRGLQPSLPPAILGGQRLQLLMDTLEARSAGGASLDQLNVPFRAIAADLATGEPVVLVDTNLATAMRASMSIPGAFTPVELDGRRLIDGGTVANLPIGIAKELGATTVIAVDISTPLDPDDDATGSFLSILNRTNNVMGQASRERDLKLLTERDVLIRPDLQDISFVDFDRSLEASEIGAAETRAVAESLTRYSRDDATWQRHLERQRRRPRGQLTIDRIRIDNRAPIDDAIIRRALGLETPFDLDGPDLLERIMRLHSLRLFGIIDSRIMEVNGERELVLTTPPHPAGRGSLQFGLGFSDDFRGNLGYTLTVRHQVIPVNRRGGEWQNVLQLGTVGLFDSAFFQPLDAGMNWFVEPGFGFRRELADLWFDGQPLVQYEIESLEARLGLGRMLGRWGELRATAFTADYRAEPRIGDPVFPPDEERGGGLRLDLRIDTVDHVAFPTVGTQAHALYYQSSEALGAESPAELFAIRIDHAVSFGRNTLRPYLEYGENSEPTLNYLDLFKLGGRGRLSGLGTNELLGEKVLLARLQYYYRLAGLRLAGISIRIFAGATLEAGNVYSLDDVISTSNLLGSWSLFLGGDTPLGPIFLGYGRTEDRDRFYLSIGGRF